MNTALIIEHRNAQGELHCDDGPALEWADGTQQYCRNGKLDREDGPAAIWADGTQIYCRNGVLDRDDGPARIFADGLQEYYRNGVLDRKDEPARIFANGYKEYWINGERVDLYHPDFGCAGETITTREQAIERLDRKPRPYTRELYMADIDKKFPIETKG